MSNYCAAPTIQFTQSTQPRASQRLRDYPQLLGNSGVALERHVADRYSFLDYAAVSGFLRTNRAVAELLLEAVPFIERIFGRGVAISLFTVNDHDAGDIALIARIQTRQTVLEAHEELKMLYCDWWNANLSRAESRLHFDLEFT